MSLIRRLWDYADGSATAMSPLALSLHFLQAQPDARLVALARDGHEPAFEALVRRYRKELLSYCRRLQPRSGSAEDALQQTLLQAWKALSAGAEIREVRPWLYRIAHNVTLNQLRAASSVPPDVSEAAGGQEVHQLVEQRLQVRAALAGMAALPALQRDVFISTTLDGATHEQVASSLGLSSGAVRGLIYRARATLRSAAAALTPSPTLHWALRRAESRAGGARAVSEMLAGGGGAGVVAAIAKGGAVLTLAVAGAGGVILTHTSSHHPEARSSRPSARAEAHSPVARFRSAMDELGRGSAPGAGAGRSHSENHLGHEASRAASERGRDSGSVGEDHGGSGGGSTGDHDRSQDGSDGGLSTTSTGSSDGGSAAGATIASSGDGVSGSSSGGASGGSDGGSSGSSSTSTSTSSGSDGGTSGGAQLTTAQTTSDGTSGSDGGASGTGSSSGSGDTTTTH